MPNRHLRLQQDDLDAAFARLDDAPPDSTASFLGVVVVETALPTETGRFVMVRPLAIDGGEGEGDEPTFAADAARVVPVVVVGDHVPAEGDHLEAYAVGGKWVAETGCGAHSDSDCPGGGTLCVTLTAVCTGNANGYTVVVKDHATGTVAASGTTSVNTVCFSGLAPGSYDVTATRSGCSSLSWTDVAVTCDATTTVTGDALCATNAAMNFTIKGCHGHPLPDAVITLSGPDSGAVTTGADGKATFYTDQTGLFTVVVTHPSGRFATLTYSLNKFTKCNPSDDVRTLSPATGFVCCAELGDLWPAVNPYPIPATLYITDGEGFTVPVTIDGSTCFGSVCDDRDMEETSACGGTICLPTYTCVGGGTANLPPADIGSQSTPLFWEIQLGDSSAMLLRQSHYRYQTLNGLTYVDGGDASHVCTPQDTRRTWRVTGACPYDNAKPHRSDSQSSTTVNSVYPLNVSFAFAPGLGFGPTPIANSVDGEPYTLSATLHE